MWVTTALRGTRIARCLPKGSATGPHPLAIKHRTFFGIGEVIGILANPGETVRSLAESKRLLEETRAEMLEQKERDSIPPKHTFAPLPGLQYREKEVKVLKTCLSSIPNFTVIFGGTSVGKTALLRQVLTDKRYHVIHFDLRMAGFADVSSLFFSFACQMEQYFVGLASRLEGYEPFQKEALAFKHLRLDTQRRVEKNGPPVKTSDVAHLLEIFQSCLLKYWEFSPVNPEETENERESISNKPVKEWERKKMKSVQDRVKQEMSFSGGHVEDGSLQATFQPAETSKGMEESRSVEFIDSSSHPPQSPSSHESHNPHPQAGNCSDQEEPSEWKPPTKLIPVFFIDEAHKLPALIKEQETMKCILDGLLVLTKQDRLCHVINATSDPFYMNWLRNMNVLTHCTIITIGDPPKKEAQQYFNENLLSTLRKKLDQQPIADTREGHSGNLVLKYHDSSHPSHDKSPNEKADTGTYELGFDLIYDTFGGKLAHLQGFVSDYLNSGGRLRPHQSSPFLQAYALLQYHLVNPQYLRGDGEQTSGPISAHSHQHPMGQQDCMSGVEEEEEVERMSGGRWRRAGREKLEGWRLLYVISKFTSYEVERGTGQILLQDEEPAAAAAGRRPKRSQACVCCSYFRLSRDVGIRAVDHLVRNRILDLRWTPPVSSDDNDDNNNNHNNRRIGADFPASHPLPLAATLAAVEPVVLPISPVMKVAMQTVLDQHFEENVLA